MIKIRLLAHYLSCLLHNISIWQQSDPNKSTLMSWDFLLVASFDTHCLKSLWFEISWANSKWLVWGIRNLEQNILRYRVFLSSWFTYNKYHQVLQVLNSWRFPLISLYNSIYISLQMLLFSLLVDTIHKCVFSFSFE